MKKVSRKKGFVIDKISEDSFYENLLLGISSSLKKCPFVSEVKLDRSPPATLQEVSNWEETNRIRLPEDMRSFYQSTDGFCFTYKFQYDRASNEEASYVMGGIQINPLSKLEKLVTDDTICLTEGGVRILITCSSIHVLSQVDEESCIVLAQFNTSKPPNIWMYYKMKTFHFLCNDFTTYFRMGLAHVGVPCWQLSVLNANIPEWSAEMVQILAPGLFNNTLYENQSARNYLDCDIFNLEESEIIFEEDKIEKKKKKTKPKK